MRTRFVFSSCELFRASSLAHRCAMSRPLNIYLSEYFASSKIEKDQEIEIARMNLKKKEE